MSGKIKRHKVSYGYKIINTKMIMPNPLIAQKEVSSYLKKGYHQANGLARKL